MKSKLDAVKAVFSDYNKEFDKGFLKIIKEHSLEAYNEIAQNILDNNNIDNLKNTLDKYNININIEHNDLTDIIRITSDKLKINNIFNIDKVKYGIHNREGG